jgi:hypothetical protein
MWLLRKIDDNAEDYEEDDDEEEEDDTDTEEHGRENGICDDY